MFIPITTAQLVTMASIGIIVAGFIALFKMCKPFNLFKSVMYVVCSQHFPEPAQNTASAIYATNNKYYGKNPSVTQTRKFCQSRPSPDTEYTAGNSNKT